MSVFSRVYDAATSGTAVPTLFVSFCLVLPPHAVVWELVLLLFLPPHAVVCELGSLSPHAVGHELDLSLEGTLPSLVRIRCRGVWRSRAHSLISFLSPHAVVHELGPPLEYAPLSGECMMSRCLAPPCPLALLFLP